MADASHRALSTVLLLTGIAFLALYPLGALLPSSWWWEPRQSDYEQMFVGVYFVVGVFAILASRQPLKHLSLIWFISISSIVHGAIMLLQALADPADRANLAGDVPALLVVGVLLAVLTPKRLTADGAGGSRHG